MDTHLYLVIEGAVIPHEVWAAPAPAPLALAPVSPGAAVVRTQREAAVLAREGGLTLAEAALLVTPAVT